MLISLKLQCTQVFYYVNYNKYKELVVLVGIAHVAKKVS